MRGSFPTHKVLHIILLLHFNDECIYVSVSSACTILTSGLWSMTRLQHRFAYQIPHSSPPLLEHCWLFIDCIMQSWLFVLSTLSGDMTALLCLWLRSDLPQLSPWFKIQSAWEEKVHQHFGHRIKDAAWFSWHRAWNELPPEAVQSPSHDTLISSPDVTPSGWLGSKHQLINTLIQACHWTHNNIIPFSSFFFSPDCSFPPN